ncbi:MAG: tRNA lysidine(34) synthetase TilS [Candidatus Saccharibacteria bacterium]
MNKYIVAVSGGVDSVVLLDMLVTKKLPTTYHLLPTNYQLIVAHFDHGIRQDSAGDAIFVAELAKKYGLQYITKREELGPNASEEKARDERYAFLRSVAEKHGAKLVTAHHADDVIESIAINLSRGTGWRGLAVIDSDVVRPLTDMNKSEILNYAKKHNLKWREDSTNSTNAYLRNRIRTRIADLDSDTKRQLLGLWATQKSTKALIDLECARLIGEGPTYSRYFFSDQNDRIGSELIRYIVKWRLTRPQRIKALHAIKTFHPNKTYLAGDGVKIYFTSRNFSVELIK